MLKQDYTTEFLDLEGVIVTKAESISGALHVSIELPRSKHRCPACSTLTDRIHDYRMQTFKDLPLGRTTVLHLRKRRYRCVCGKRFFEKNTFLPRYYRATSRLIAAIISAFRSNVSAQKIAMQYHASGTTAMRYFKCVSFRPAELPELLSPDEFKGNSGGRKYNSIIVDAEKHRVIDILPNRFKNDLIPWMSYGPTAMSKAATPKQRSSSAYTMECGISPISGIEFSSAIHKIVPELSLRHPDCRETPVLR